MKDIYTLKDYNQSFSESKESIVNNTILKTAFITVAICVTIFAVVCA